MAQGIKKMHTFADRLTATDMGERKDTTIIVILKEGRKSKVMCFGSFAAIFDYLTDEQIGVKKEYLWYSKIEYDVPFVTPKATIIKTERHTKKQVNRK